MYKFLIIIVSLFFITDYRLLAQGSSKEEEALFVAKKAFEDGFYEVSLGLLERFSKNYPDSAKLNEVDLLIGRCYFEQARFLEALDKFEGLLNKPDTKDIRDASLYWIAEVHFKGNNFDKAAMYYKKIIDELPESIYVPSSFYSLGWCFYKGHNFKEALEYFEIVEDRYPKEDIIKDAHLKIIECLYNLKNYTSLREKIKSYLKVYSQDSAVLDYLYFYMAEADFYLNNFGEAIEEYSLVLKNSSDEKINALSKLGIGWSYLKLKKYAEAEGKFLEIKSENLEKKDKDTLLLGKAILMTQTNRTFEAKKIYDDLLNITADPVILAQGYLGKADSLYNLADYEDAVNVYKEALQKIPQESINRDIIDKLHYGLAWSYLKQGEFKEAIKEFQKIAKTSDDKIVKISALCQIGDAYHDQGDFVLAQETYDSILKEYPDSFYSDYVQYQLGLILLKVSNYDGAIMGFLTLQRNFPHSKLLDDAAYALGLAYFQRQDYNSSIETFKRFQNEFMESNLRAQAMYLLGTSLYNLGRFNEAIEIFKDIIRIYTHDVELVQKAEYEIADCFYQMGNEKEALERFKLLRSKYPDSSLTSEIMWWLGEYYYRHNELVLARRYFSSLIQDFPKSNLVADAYYALGTSYIEESKYEEAIQNFRMVLEQSNTDLGAQAGIAIADIYTKQEKIDSALKTFEDILKEHPHLNNIIYPKMAHIYYKMGNLTQALDFYRKSLDLVPLKDMPGIQLKIAEILQTQGKPEQAIEEYLKVSYFFPENQNLQVKALLRVAEIYEDKENFKEAVNIYKRVISMGVEEAKFAQERIDQIKIHWTTRFMR